MRGIVLSKFSLFRCYVQHDYGAEYNFIFLTFNKKSLFQLSLGWFDYSTSPYLHLTIGSNSLLSLLLCIGKFSLCFDILGNTWKEFTNNN